MILLLLTACAGPSPQRFAECSALEDAVARQECWYGFAQPLAADPAALEAAITSVEAPAERDLLITRLIVADPRSGPRLCAQVSTPPGQEKCRQVLGRPHLGAPRKRERPQDPPPQASP